MNDQHRDSGSKIDAIERELRDRCVDVNLSRLAKDHGVSYDRLWNSVKGGKRQKRMSPDILELLMDVFGLASDALGGCHDGPRGSLNPTDAAATSGDALYQAFSEYERPGRLIQHHSRLIPAPLLTTAVRVQHNQAIAAARFPSDQLRALQLSEFNDRWQDARKARFMAAGQSIPTVGSVFRDGFELLVNREFPYHTCSPMQVEQCLHFIRDECIAKRGYGLRLIEKSELDAASRFQLGVDDTVAVVAGRLLVNRRRDLHVEWTDDPDEIAGKKSMLESIQSKVHHGIDKGSLLREIDRYLLQVTKEKDDDCRMSEEELH